MVNATHKLLNLNTEFKFNKNESVTNIMEPVLFTNTVQNELKNISFVNWFEIMDLLSLQHKLKCSFINNKCKGLMCDISKARVLVYESATKN